MEKINRNLNIIDQSIQWGKKYITDEATEHDLHRSLIEIKSEIEKIKFAMSERCAAATYGESQMGKSYLVNAMFSDPSEPFAVLNAEGRACIFKTEINPSEANSQIEATGVVTRFTKNLEIPQDVPNGFLQVELLSVADLILVLCEAFNNNVDYTLDSRKESKAEDYLNKWTESIKLNMSTAKFGGSQQLLSEVDILNMEDYFRNSQLAKNCGHILATNFFQYLLQNVTNLSESELIVLIQQLWNNQESMNDLFHKLIEHYRILGFSSKVYVEFDAILKKHGTLVDVARLDEMYIETPDVCPPQYKATTNVYIPKLHKTIEFKKSFLSALIAELTLSIALADNNDSSREFFDELDILDFPGACPDETFSLSALKEPKKRTRVFRRGKVTYLFKKYSTSKRISTLLFCHNNHQSKYGLMGRELQNWIYDNVGRDTKEREKNINKISVSPFFIISTWFNTDLEYADKTEGDDLSYLWQRRFKAVLSTDVLKYGTVEEHWFDHWSDSQKNFQNIFLLRDFDHSKMIYYGYDPNSKSAESGIHKENYLRYPNFLDELKRSFVTNDFVRKHFQDPNKSWEESATPTNDGTKPVMRALNSLAPNIANARETYFREKLEELYKKLHEKLNSFHESDNDAENLKKAKKQFGRIRLAIDSQNGKDQYFFGRMMDTIMIPEAALYEIVFEQLNGQQQGPTLTDKEAEVFMNAKLSSKLSREENIKRLCDYLEADDENECRERLLEEGIDLDVLLSKSQMQVAPEEQMVNLVEKYWYNHFLMDSQVNLLKTDLQFANDIFKTLYSLYEYIKIHDRIVENVRRYRAQLNSDVQVRIIADYLAMEFNHFTMCFGYDYLREQDILTLKQLSDDNLVKIDWEVLNHKKTSEGPELLAKMAEIKDILSKNGYDSQEIRSHQLELPEYKSRWSWQEQIKVAQFLTCKLPKPKYGIEANDKIGEIIKEFEK